MYMPMLAFFGMVAVFMAVMVLVVLPNKQHQCQSNNDYDELEQVFAGRLLAVQFWD